MRKYWLLPLIGLMGCQTTSGQGGTLTNAEWGQALSGAALREAVTHRKMKVTRGDYFDVLKIARDGRASHASSRGHTFEGPWRVTGDKFCITAAAPEAGCYTLYRTGDWTFRAVHDSGAVSFWLDQKNLDRDANERD